MAITSRKCPRYATRQEKKEEIPLKNLKGKKSTAFLIGEESV